MYSPLFLGQILQPTPDILDEVADVVLKKTQPDDKLENLAKGLITEYCHNVAFFDAGWEIERSDTHAVYDRKLNGIMQDDKLSLLRPDGTHGHTHSISDREYQAWVKEVEEGRDVIIHSFEQVDDGRQGARYRGAISFKKLQDEGLLQWSKLTFSYYFDRHSALRRARV